MTTETLDALADEFRAAMDARPSDFDRQDEALAALSRGLRASGRGHARGGRLYRPGPCGVLESRLTTIEPNPETRSQA